MSILGPDGNPQLTGDQLNNANEKAKAKAFMKVLKDASDLCCEKCQGLNFIEVVRLKKISGLVTGTGKDALVPLRIYACADCGHVNSIFLTMLETPLEKE